MLKRILTILLNTAALIILMIVIFQHFMNKNAPINSHIDVKIIERITSPDTKVDALLARGSGGATAPIIDEIYIVPHALNWNRRKDYARFIGQR